MVDLEGCTFWRPSPRGRHRRAGQEAEPDGRCGEDGPRPSPARELVGSNEQEAGAGPSHQPTAAEAEKVGDQGSPGGGPGLLACDDGSVGHGRIIEANRAGAGGGWVRDLAVL